MKNLLLVLCVVSLLAGSGCATILTARPDKCQLTRPACGEPVRALRTLPLLGDVAIPAGAGIAAGLVAYEWFPIMVIYVGIDFATNKIYKPCPKPK